jgi:CRP-like cAMP-binding protein
MWVMKPQEWSDLVLQDAALAHVPPELGVGARLQSAKAQEILARQGSAPESIYYVLKGELRLARPLKDGSEIVLQRVGHGFIAESTLLTPHYEGDLIASTPTRCIAFELESFAASLRADATLRDWWSSGLVREIQKLREQCERLALRGAGNRVVHFIEAEGAGGELHMNRSVRAWAHDLGLTREALHRALRTLSRDGAISVEGRVIRLGN